MKRLLYIFIFIIGIHSAGFSQTVDEQPVKLVRFYPNPAISYINFEIPDNTNQKELSLQIYNFIGKKIIDLPNIATKVNLSLNDFFRGIYIYQVRNKTGKVIESGKFQVVK